MADKDKNYISAVIYLGDQAGSASEFLPVLCGELQSRFDNYELVFVEDCSADGTQGEVRRVLDEMEEAPPVTMIHMSLRQGLELAMNAGLDMAVGDFVYEFDSMQMPYPKDMILKAYDTSLLGNDIVSVAPSKNRSAAAHLFYKVFNSASRSKYPLRTDVFRVLSRRAVNRVHSITATMPYRKAAYAACGLKMETLEFAGLPGGSTESLRFTRAVDSLALYTDIASRFSIGIAFTMLGLMILALAYTLLVNLTGIVPAPVRGWTTMMLMLTGGFFAVFLLLAFVLKYLTLMVDLIFRKQKYLVESVEKIQ